MRTSSVFGSKIWVIGVLVAGLTLTGCSSLTQRLPQLSEPSPQPTSQTENTSLLPPGEQPQIIEATATMNGETALEVLQSVASVQVQESSLGVFVEGVNGLMGDNEHYWAFYVNSEYANQGVGATVLKAGDVVRFEYTSLDGAPIMDESETTQASESSS